MWSSPQTAILAKAWHADTQPVELEDGPRVALPKCSVEQLREAANSFSTVTTHSWEGLHPRHWAMVEDEGLMVTSTLFMAMEMLGMLPPCS